LQTAEKNLGGDDRLKSAYSRKSQKADA
jgi:hypothetical protein